MSEYDKVILCRECGEPTIKKQAATSFNLAGGGWFKDGYSNNSDE